MKARSRKVVGGPGCGPDERKEDVGGNTTSDKLTNGHQVVISQNRSATTDGWSRICCRRILQICKWLFFIAVIPPFLNYAALQKEISQLKPEAGQLYDIGHGQKLYLSCQGNGLPTVLLDAPTGFSSDIWISVQTKVAKLTKVCVYDRAGLGFSDRPAPMKINDTVHKGTEFTVERMVDDLRGLITISSPQPTPLILVGAEMGALVARFYAHIYENDVSDLVLIDPLVENILTIDEGVWNKFWFGQLVPAYQALQIGAATGWSRIALLLGLIDAPLSGDGVEESIIRRQKYLMCYPRHLSTAVDEHYFINETISQMKTLKLLKPFPANISVTVVNGNYYDEQLPSTLNKAWAKSQQHLLTKLHSNAQHIVLNGVDHSMIHKTPDLIGDTIIRVVKRAKAKAKAKVVTR